MREFKFRAWDTERGEMAEVISGVGDEEVTLQDEGCWKWNTVAHYIAVIMQYTGLKDKNGKEIYEGDVLLTDLDRPYLIVEFRNGAFMYQCHDNGRDYYDIMLPLSIAEHTQDKYVEVIGNIYENPELLEGY